MLTPESGVKRKADSYSVVSFVSFHKSMIFSRLRKKARIINLKSKTPEIM